MATSPTHDHFRRRMQRYRGPAPQPQVDYCPLNSGNSAIHCDNRQIPCSRTRIIGQEPDQYLACEFCRNAARNLEMARPEGETSNSFRIERLFATLTEWDKHLKGLPGLAPAT